MNEMTLIENPQQVLIDGVIYETRNEGGEPVSLSNILCVDAETVDGIFVRTYRADAHLRADRLRTRHDVRTTATMHTARFCGLDVPVPFYGVWTES